MKVEVAPIEQFPPGSATSVMAGAREVAVFNVDGQLFALDNRCAHHGGPLADGVVRDGVVTCPWHWWRYELATGRRLGSERIAVGSFPVWVEDGNVVVEAPVEPAPKSLRDQLLEHAREWTRDS